MVLSVQTVLPVNKLLHIKNYTVSFRYLIFFFPPHSSSFHSSSQVQEFLSGLTWEDSINSPLYSLKHTVYGNATGYQYSAYDTLIKLLFIMSPIVQYFLIYGLCQYHGWRNSLMEWQGLFAPNEGANMIINRELYSLIQISIWGDTVIHCIHEVFTRKAHKNIYNRPG